MGKPRIPDLRDVGTKVWSHTIEPDVWANAVSFSPDGKVLAVVCLNLVIIVDASTGEEVARIDDLNYFRTVVLWLDGGARLAVQVPEKLRLYKRDNWCFDGELGLSIWNTEPDVDVLGKRIASAFKVVGHGDARGYQGFGLVTVRSVDEWEVEYTVRTNRYCGGLIWSPNIQLTHWDYFDRISIWDPTEKVMVKETKLPEDRVLSVAWHPSGDSFVVGSKFDANLYVFDFGSGELQNKLDVHDDGAGIYLASFSSDGTRFVSKDNSWTAQTIFWDAEKWEPLCSYRPHVEGGARRRVPLGAIRPHYKTLITLNDECTGIDAWSLPS